MAVLKLSQIASSPSNFVAADTLIGVHGGSTDYQFSGTQILAFVNANLPGTFSGFANPTASVGLTAVNGTATTAMRSDGAPALDQTAAYAFSGLGATVINQMSAGVLALTVSGGGNSTRQITFTPNSGVAYGIGSPNGGSGFIVFGSGNTQLWGVIGGNTLIPAGSTYGWASSTSVTGSNDLILSRAAAATLQLGAANAASPVAQTLQAQGSRAGTDSNVAGAKLSINPGAGTGNAVPNPLQLNSYVAVASGTGAQTLTNTLTLNSGLLQFNQYTTAGLLQNDASGNVTTNSAVNASTIPANFLAADRLTIVISGTTYYIPLATVAF